MNNIRFFLIALFFAAPTYAGQKVGNGGDLIVCSESSLNEFNGTYSLDYLLTKIPGDHMAEVDSLQQSLDRIGNLLEEKLPSLADSFRVYVSFLPPIPTPANYLPDYSAERTWEPRELELANLEDENIVQEIPENCKENGEAQLIQAALRQSSVHSRRPMNRPLYTFIPSVLNALVAVDSLQVSFLIVHEWLWDVNLNVGVNRKLNWLLHSKQLDNLSSESLKEQIRGIGLRLPEATSNYFAKDSCTADPESFARYYHQSELIIGAIRYGNFQYHQRERNCYENGCTAWENSDFGFLAQELIHEDHQAVRIFPDMEEQDTYFLNLKNTGSITRSQIYTRCRVGKLDAKVSCNAWRDEHGIRYFQGEELQFKGVISSQCMKLTAKRIYENYNSVRNVSYITEKEMLIHSKQNTDEQNEAWRRAWNDL